MIKSNDIFIALAIAATLFVLVKNKGKLTSDMEADPEVSNDDHLVVFGYDDYHKYLP